MGGGRIYTNVVTIGDILIHDVISDPNGSPPPSAPSLS